MTHLETKQPANPNRKLWLLWPVVLAGEAVFLLPFVLPRLFRPTMMKSWGISNLDFGLAFSCYGIVAIMAYGVGGPLSDRFPPRWLMCLALIATASGGFALLGTPSRSVLFCVYAYFGITTILLFWSAMLKVTHTLGGSRRQSTAFGLLDAGRGLFAALIATTLTFLFGELLPSEQDASPEQLASALRMIIVVTMGLIIATAIVFPIALSQLGTQQGSGRNPFPTRADLTQLLRRPSIWLHGIVVLCAYCGYKSIDNYGIFSVDVYKTSDLAASQLTTLTIWTRPVAAIGAGLVADRFGHFRSMTVLFILASLGNAMFAALGPNQLPWLALMMAIVCTAATFYGLRGIYFGVFDDLHIPPTLLGTAAGFVSLLGFLPDVFLGPVTGYLIDEHPGHEGHQYVFILISCVSLVGLLACQLNVRYLARR